MFQEIIPMQDLVRYTKSSSISTSHVHLYDAESVPVACSIFKVNKFIFQFFFRPEQSYFKSHKSRLSLREICPRIHVQS